MSLELDGTNSINNLWPQSYFSNPLNAHRKDVLENVLHKLVCSGKLALHDAQIMISTDWVKAYDTLVLHEQTDDESP